MSTATQISDKYPVKKRFKHLNVSNLYSIVMAARKGIRSNVFYDFAEVAKVSEKTLAGMINLSARTVSNYKERQKTLEPAQSEHLLKLIALYEKGESTFGNVDEFNYWLRKAFWNSRETPLEWINTPGGVDLLMEELEKLGQGYPV